MMSRYWTFIPIFGLAVVMVSGCVSHTKPVSLEVSPTAPVAPPERDVSPSGLLRNLTVAPEDSTAPYDRDDWPHWSTHHGWPYAPECDTRDILLLDTGGKHPKNGSGADPDTCAVTSGRWLSPYDMVTVTDPHRIEIDHVVPLAEATRSGARQWDEATRQRFANDRASLVTSTETVNREKSDGDPAQWRPPQRVSWCQYSRMYADTKIRYRLTVDTAEYAALATMLTSCSESTPQARTDR